MRFMSRFFATRRIRSPLEQFGDGLTPHAIPAALRTHGSRDDRIVCGVATAVLVTAHSFASGFQKFLSEMPYPGRKDNHQLPYDDMMIEAAAYCHFVLSRDYPPGEDDDDSDEVGDLDDLGSDAMEDINGSDACAKAIFFSQALLARYMPTGHPANFFERRILFYLGKILPRDERAVAEFFSSVVLAIIDGKLPQTSGLKGLGPGLQFSLAAGAYIPIFHQTHVAALREIVQNLFEKADELLRECSP